LKKDDYNKAVILFFVKNEYSLSSQALLNQQLQRLCCVFGLVSACFFVIYSLSFSTSVSMFFSLRDRAVGARLKLNDL